MCNVSQGKTLGFSADYSLLCAMWYIIPSKKEKADFIFWKALKEIELSSQVDDNPTYWGLIGSMFSTKQCILKWTLTKEMAQKN